MTGVNVFGPQNSPTLSDAMLSRSPYAVKSIDTLFFYILISPDAGGLNKTSIETRVKSSKMKWVQHIMSPDNTY